MNRSHSTKGKTNINCKTAEDWLGEALDERLSASEARAFQAHILACRSCRKAFDSLKSLAGWTDRLPRQTISQGFAKTLQQRIASGEGSPVAALMPPIPMIQKFKLFASGAVTAAAVLLGFLLLYDGLKGNDASDPYLDEGIETAASEIENMKRDLGRVDVNPSVALQLIRERSDAASRGIQNFFLMFKDGPFRLSDTSPGVRPLRNAQSALDMLQQFLEKHEFPHGNDVRSMGQKGSTVLQQVRILIRRLPDPDEMRRLRFHDGRGTAVRIRFNGWSGSKVRADSSASGDSSSGGGLRPVPGQSRED